MGLVGEPNDSFFLRPSAPMLGSVQHLHDSLIGSAWEPQRD